MLESPPSLSAPARDRSSSTSDRHREIPERTGRPRTSCPAYLPLPGPRSYPKRQSKTTPDRSHLPAACPPSASPPHRSAPSPQPRPHAPRSSASSPAPSQNPQPGPSPPVAPALARPPPQRSSPAHRASAPRPSLRQLQPVAPS